MSVNAIVGILVDAATSADAIRGLYKLRKERNAKFSLGFLGRAAGIPSTGYLSDVMSGKRLLHTKYRDAVALAFGLEDETAELFHLLCAVDELTADDPERPGLAQRTATLRKALRIAHRPTPSGGREFRLALEVFCAFSLFKNEPSLADLEGFFGAERRGELEASLALLESMQMIARAGERWTVQSTHIVFGAQNGGRSHIDYLRATFEGTAQDIERWFDRKDEAYFSSMIFSVERQRFAAVLKEFKRQVMLTHAELESTEADMLISFNVQVYPLGAGRS